jgi:hypothetical protein
MAGEAEEKAGHYLADNPNCILGRGGFNGAPGIDHDNVGVQDGSGNKRPDSKEWAVQPPELIAWHEAIFRTWLNNWAQL